MEAAMVTRCAVAVAIILSTSSAAVAGSDGHVSGFVQVALNPQPEPPGDTARSRLSVSGHARVELNPQPEPPGITDKSTSGHARVQLNPQPEPPGVTDARRLPPGPCSTLRVKIDAEGAEAVTTHARTTAVPGKCAYSAVVPRARVGTIAKVTFTRKP
jgi:hypothetical protein